MELGRGARRERYFFFSHTAKARKTLRDTYRSYHDVTDRNQPEAIRKLRNIAERTFRGSRKGTFSQQPSAFFPDYTVRDNNDISGMETCASTKYTLIFKRILIASAGVKSILLL